MENDNPRSQGLHTTEEGYLLPTEAKKPWIVFHAFALEMWFWRIAVPVTLLISIFK